MLTKQLQVLIDVSLSSGRSFDDIRNILQIQGYTDEKIDVLFESYRASGQPPRGYTQGTGAGAPVAPPAQVPVQPPVQTPAPASVFSPAPQTPPAPVIMPKPTTPPTEFSQAFADTPASAPAPAVAPTPAPAAPSPHSFDVAPEKVLPGASYVADFIPSEVPAATVEETMTSMGGSEAMSVEISSDFAPNQMAATAHTTPMVGQEISNAMAAMSPEAAAAYAKTQRRAPASVPAPAPAPAILAKPLEREAPIIMPHHDGISDRQSDAPLRIGYEAGSITAPSQMAPETAMPHKMSMAGMGSAPAQAPAPFVPPVLTNVPRAGAINVGLGGIPELENAALEDYKRKQAKSPVLTIIMLVTVVIIIAGFAFWFFTVGPGASEEVPVRTTSDTDTPSLTDDVATTPTTPAANVDIDPFTGAPRLPDAPATIVTVPTTTAPVAATCGPFVQNLKIGDTGSGVVTLQAHFEAIGVFALLNEYVADNDTFVNGARENGVYNAYLQQAVRLYQSVMFDGTRGVSGVQQGAIDSATRSALSSDCDGSNFSQWYTEIRNTKRDVAVQSLLGNARLTIFAYADAKNGSYAGMCDESAELVKTLEQVDAITTAQGAVICTTTADTWLIAAPLFSSVGYYCMDGAKNSLQVPYVSADQTACK
jgi:hypothetical protein